MVYKIKTLYHQYPPQYWLMIAGIVISTAGGSMIWPFLLIYAGGKLDMPLSSVAALISINAGTGLFSSFLAGSLADRIGRKIVMVFSLAMMCLAYFLLMQAETYQHFAALMVMIGLSNPLYQVGADAMLADMIPTEQRTDAYAINRIANNAAFALGPAVGGFLASTSYDFAFIGASTGFGLYALLLFALARETMPAPILASSNNSQDTPQNKSVLYRSRIPFASQAENAPSTQNGYAQVFNHKSYIAFVTLVSIGLIAPTMMWILMPVYAKTNYAIPESLYGWIPTTNALMCVFIQYPVTQIARKYKTLPVTAIGMFIYALGAGSVALMTSFPGFLISMVILTFGELVLVPTASKYVADIAPADLRGRYMSIYWLGWGLARTLSPLIGGFLNDNFFPQAIWVGGLLIGLSSVLGLIAINSITNSRATRLSSV